MKWRLFWCWFVLAGVLAGQSRPDSLERAISRAEGTAEKIALLRELFEYYHPDSVQRARQTAERAVRLAGTTTDGRLRAIAHNQFGNFLAEQSRMDSAITHFQTGLHQARAGGYDAGISAALSGLGHSYWRMGNFERARAYYDENFALVKRIGDRAGIAGHHRNLGNLYAETGDYTLAMEQYVLAADLFKSLHQERDYAAILGNIGLVQRRLENYPGAIRYLLQSDSIYRQLDYKPGLAYVAYNLAVIYKNTGALPEALRYNQLAEAGYRSLGHRKRLGYVYYTMGSIFERQHEMAKAVAAYRQSLDLSLASQDSVNAGYACQAIGHAYALLGDPRSEEYLLRALALARQLKLELIEMEVVESLADGYAAAGDFAAAYRYTRRYAAIRDSFYTLEKRDLAREIEAKYQNEQKAREIELLEATTTLQALTLSQRLTQRNVIAGFALLALLLAGLWYRQYRTKRKANEALERLDRVKSNFFANISHEFRTPLTLIQGPLETLARNPNESLAPEQLSSMRRNTDRVLRLVDQLLDLSGIDTGELRIVPTDGDVFHCLRNVAALFSAHASQRRIDFRIDLPDTPLWVSFDRDKLEKILYNLLGNAFKFSDDGSTIQCRAGYVDGELRLRVSDTGIGIPAAHLPFVFDRFYQVDTGTAKSRPGTGIGLALIHELVTLLGGSIQVTSTAGEGTTFRIRLAMARVAPQPHARPSPAFTGSSPRSADSSFELRPLDERELPLVLLVEDDAELRRFIAEQLHHRYRIREAADGRAAKAAILEEEPELIITDLMMPDMDGIALSNELKNDPRTGHIPIILLTARAGVSEKLAGLKTGVDDYLIKPYAVEELLARSQNLIEQRRQLRELFAHHRVGIDPQLPALSSADRQFLANILELLERNFGDAEFGSLDLQSALGISKAQLHRRVKALTAESPGELLRNFRLKRAAQLLARRTDSVTQIAYQVGFNNLSYFAKCFKEKYGVAPSAFANE
jgi:signal transduction histidine kinase/AraC-like DNA-binding protein